MKWWGWLLVGVGVWFVLKQTDNANRVATNGVRPTPLPTGGKVSVTFTAGNGYETTFGIGDHAPYEFAKQ